jgi:hypothetical protein
LKTFTIDGRQVQDFDDFVEAVNVGLVRAAGGEWNGNLDAFNDYLAWPSEDAYELVLLGASHCAAKLAENARGGDSGPNESLFDAIVGIVRDNPHVSFMPR